MTVLMENSTKCFTVAGPCSSICLKHTAHISMKTEVTFGSLILVTMRQALGASCGIIKIIIINTHAHR